MTCKTCKWWEEMVTGNKDDGNPLGVCHFSPPTAHPLTVPEVNRFTNKVTPKTIELTMWPRTTSQCWCAMWVASKEHAEEIVEEVFASDGEKSEKKSDST